MATQDIPPFDVVSDPDFKSHLVLTSRRVSVHHLKTFEIINTGLEFLVPNDTICLVNPCSPTLTQTPSWTILPQVLTHSDTCEFQLIILKFDDSETLHIEPGTPIARLTLAQAIHCLAFAPSENSDDDTARRQDRPCRPVVLSPTQRRSTDTTTL